jgi:phage tail sheath protein FI
MSLALSYPGIYIQELPLSAHTISPAPTSIAAFVGYTHPWKTQAFNTAVQIFSYSDYEASFGGIYSSASIVSDVARAVYEFFQNGGANAYVIGLQPGAYVSSSSGPVAQGVFGPASGQIAPTAKLFPDGGSTNGILVTGLEPTDTAQMTVTITNIRTSTSSAYDTFDLVVAYGSRIETYRSLTLAAAGSPGDMASKINPVSSLINVGPLTPGGSYGASFPTSAQMSSSLSMALPAGFATSFNASDFISIFQQNSSLDNVEIFNLLLIPGVSDNLVVSAALAFAETKRAFAILDPPPMAPANGAGSIDKLMTSFPQSQNGALYFPYLTTTDPVTTNPIAMPPSGYVAGVYARTDSTRGVWKAPAGIATNLLDTTGPVASGVMNDMQQGVLNGASVNCLRQFASIGTVVFGARTLVAANVAYQQSMYVPVRRMTLFIEQTLLANLKWVVFEPNDEPLWLAIRSSIEAFLLSLFNQQALQGSTPSQAFQVKCDSSTTTSDDQATGIVNIVVGVALLKPAEFVVIKIAQIAGQSAS